MIKFNPKSRRHFLIDSGKCILALPFLSSLVPDKVYAGQGRKKFVSMTMYNGMRYEYWNPPLAPNQSSEGVRYRNLADFAGIGVNKIIGPEFDPYLNRMNFIKGLDFAAQYGHNDGDGTLGCMNGAEGWGTIDNVLAGSTKFYKGEIPTVSSLIVSIGGKNGLSKKVSNGIVTPIPPYSDPMALFDRIFFATNPADKDKNLKIVDRVLASYKETLNSSRLSSEDKLRMQSFIEHLNQTENRMKSQRPLEKSKPSPPIWNSASTRDRYRVMNDLMVLALECEATQVICFEASAIPRLNEVDGFSDPTGLDSRGLWHEDHHVYEDVTTTTATSDSDKGCLRNILTYSKWHTNNVILDFVKKMSNVTEANGRTMLDNSLVLWSNEMSYGKDHEQENMPVVLFGSAGGTMATGRYLDYSQMSFPARSATMDVRPGRLYNQLIASILQTMGLSPADYERTGQKGYGIMNSLNSSRNLKYSQVKADVGNLLPRWIA